MMFKFYLMPTRRWTQCRHVILWLFKIRYGIGVSDTCRASVDVRHGHDTHFEVSVLHRFKYYMKL